MAHLILSTGNIVAGGPSIIRKPGAYRSNLELTNSLRSNFEAAKQDFVGSESVVNGNGKQNGNGISNGNGTDHGHCDPRQPDYIPMSGWTRTEGSNLYIPEIDWTTAGLQEEPSQYDATVKLFFLPTAPAASRSQYAREALDLVLRQLKLPCIDLLIVSFPGMSFEGDCEWEADKINGQQGNDEEEISTWKVMEELQAAGLVRRLGVAEFGSEKLSTFLKHVSSPPTVDQINIKNCCNVPPPLIKLAKEQAIELLTHSDCTDILPEGTLRELLGPGPQAAGVLAERQAHPKSEVSRLHGELIPQWVIKYTAVVRDRGVIENKGYFAGAELIEA